MTWHLKKFHPHMDPCKLPLANVKDHLVGRLHRSHTCWQHACLLSIPLVRYRSRAGGNRSDFDILRGADLCFSLNLRVPNTPERVEQTCAVNRTGLKRMRGHRLEAHVKVPGIRSNVWERTWQRGLPWIVSLGHRIFDFAVHFRSLREGGFGIPSTIICRGTS